MKYMIKWTIIIHNMEQNICFISLSNKFVNIINFKLQLLTLEINIIIVNKMDKN